MFHNTEHYYDAIYFQFKDYRVECSKIAALIEARMPGARTILDVACGTGEHARLLAEEHGYQVDGIDLNQEFVNIARRKNPGGTFTVADMSDFHLGRQYDVVICLFSSIGYITSRQGVIRTLRCFSKHLVDNGLIIVEPWFTPEQWHCNNVHMCTTETEEFKICRMGFSSQRNNIAVIRMEYLIGNRHGIEHRVEHHELALFSIAELQSCFDQAQLSAEHEQEGIFGRGLFLVRKRLE